MIRCIFILIFSIPFLLNGQNIKIEFQSQIDSFDYHYPNIGDLNALRIEGADITNLSGLNSITGIKNLVISNTSLKSFIGLENVDHILYPESDSTYLSINNNQQLESLEGLENFDFWFVHIVKNPKLEYCNIPSLCKFFKKNSYSYMRENGSNCFNVFNDCDLGCNRASKFKVLHEGFEINNEFHNDQTDIGFDGNEMFEIIDPIGDGQFSLKIRNNSNFMFEGPSTSYFTLDTLEIFESIDIEFTYQCLGEGFCLLTFTDYNQPWWRAEAGDSTIYTICLEDVSLISTNSNYNNILFASSPIYTGLGSYGNCEFVIDDINIYIEESNQNVEANSEISIFPNPVVDWLNIETQIANGSIIIIDCLGRVVDKQEFKNALNLTNLPKGMYFIVFDFDEASVVKKIIKN